MSEIPTDERDDGAASKPPHVITFQNEHPDVPVIEVGELPEYLEIEPDAIEADYTDSQLPTQAIVPRKGQPSDNISVVVEGEAMDNAPKRFLGKDNEYHIENPRAAQAFEDYVNLGVSRTLDKLASMYFNGKNPAWANVNSHGAVRRMLANYSANFDWQNRLRLRLVQQSTRAITNAQKNAAKHTQTRIHNAQLMQRVAKKIFEKAAILDEHLGDGEDELTPAEARQLLKPATVMMQHGLAAERVEIGESIARLMPPIPIDQMSEEQLDEWIAVLREES